MRNTHLTEDRRDFDIDQFRFAQWMLTDTGFIDADIQALEEELTTITECCACALQKTPSTP